VALKEKISNLFAQREVKDVIYLLALQGLNYIAPLLVLPYLMKVLGAEKFGYIGFSLSVMQYLMLVVDFGFNLTATKKIALCKDNQTELNKIFSSTLYAKILLLFFSLILLVVISLMPQFVAYRNTMFLMFLMVIGNTFSFVWLFQGLGYIRWISIFNMIAKLSILPLTFIFVKQPGDYMIAAFLQSFVAVFATIITVSVIVRKKFVSLILVKKQDVFLELKESYSIFLSSAATSVYTASFVLILGYFSTPVVVGQYAAVDRIMRALCYLILMPVLQAYYPKISRLSSEDNVQAIRMVWKLLFFILVSMIAVFVSLFFLSPYITMFLGKDYLETISVFRIMAFVPIFVGVGGVVGQLGILALGREEDKRKYQRVYFIAAFVALISVCILTPYYNAEGAAIALLLTEIVVCGLMIYFGYNLLRRDSIRSKFNLQL
jgi:O-antigen/teichoic acid export membrane protein